MYNWRLTLWLLASVLLLASIGFASPPVNPIPGGTSLLPQATPFPQVFLPYISQITTPVVIYYPYLSLTANGPPLPVSMDYDYMRPLYRIPRGTQTVYIVVKFSQIFDLRVKVYSPKGDMILDRTIPYPGQNQVVSIEVTYPNGPFPDYDNARYLVNMYHDTIISDQFFFKTDASLPTATLTTTVVSTPTFTATAPCLSRC